MIKIKLNIEFVFIFLFGCMATYIEFLNIKRSALFFSWIDYAPFVCLIISIVISLILIVIRHGKRNYFPFLIGIAFCTTILTHNLYLNSLEKSAILLFEARNNEIGNDGGLILYFYENGFLKAEKRDHWMVTNYYGYYDTENDTISIDNPVSKYISEEGYFESESKLVFNWEIEMDVIKK